MAGEWLPLRLDLDEDPAVIKMADRLGLNELDVIGRLWKFWRWANRQLADGYAPGVTGSWIDRHVSTPGFAAAMAEAEWLTITPEGVQIPDFEEWNSQGAKVRLLTAKRMRKTRSKSDGPRATDVTPPASQERHQRRGEESNTQTPPTPPSGGGGGGVVPVVKVTPADVLATWNTAAEANGWRKCLKLTEKRARSVRARLEDPWWVEHWRPAIERAGLIPGTKGVNKDEWRADLDWFVRPNTVAKLMEGKYDTWGQPGADNGQARSGEIIDYLTEFTDAEADADGP